METLERVDVQKKLMADLHLRGAPFLTRREKISYCENFYRSLGVEYGRNTGRRIPIHVSSAVRHFFHNNIQIGDVPKWARDDANMIKMFIEVLRIYGPDKAKVKARRATLHNPRKLQVIPPEERESFAHMLDDYDLDPENEDHLKRRRPRQSMSVSPTPIVPDLVSQEAKCAQLRQMLALLTGNLIIPSTSPTLPMQLLLQNAMASVVPTIPQTLLANVQSPALAAALNISLSASNTEILPDSPEGTKENLPENGLKHSYTMENILEKIRRTKFCKEPGEI